MHDGGIVDVELERPRVAPLGALDDALGQRAEVDVLEIAILGPPLDGEVDELGHERAELLELEGRGFEELALLVRVHVGSACEQLDVGPQGRERRAQLVAGVHHELVLLVARSREGMEHRVEARREPADLVGALDLDRLGEVGRLPRCARSSP